jgi:hypothetical protein
VLIIGTIIQYFKNSCCSISSNCLTGVKHEPAGEGKRGRDRGKHGSVSFMFLKCRTNGAGRAGSAGAGFAGPPRRWCTIRPMLFFGSPPGARNIVDGISFPVL